MTMPRCVAGVEWESDSKRLPQITLQLTQEECWTFQTAGRLQRLKDGAGPGAHVQLVERPKALGPPVLVITGTKEDSVVVVRDEAVRMLSTDQGLRVALHPHDVKHLRAQSCLLLEELERESGCRILVSDRPKQQLDDLQCSSQHHDVILLGDQGAQARAIEVLAKCCLHPLRPEAGPTINMSNCMRERPAAAFDAVRRGENVHLDEGGSVARRSADCAGLPVAGCCVVALNGAVAATPVGAWFCMRIRRVLLDRGHRGATRIAISELPIEAPVPDTLIRAPERIWAFGRGAVRGPDGFTHPLPCAEFDSVREGDDLGVLVSKGRGGIAVFRRRPREALAQVAPGHEGWICILHCAAELDATAPVYALLELAGRPMEVELLARERPPQGLAREPDWPPKQPLLPQAPLDPTALPEPIETAE
eukprot:CAMPEP_0176087186 /NCGR_PEP_ID=MMETSP0120_2-20121206/43646_1 /TAXON_ID=160619 /ORGANISM="Kryptoperidinium foliaceum, Strain CCMP 1326" /LENGTH=420 /DNA_ID=CAMNT_0017421025 /DNA_START=56 /DNA_END=1318 /DNA_ORIENTATION=+